MLRPVGKFFPSNQLGRVPVSPCLSWHGRRVWGLAEVEVGCVARSDQANSAEWLQMTLHQRQACSCPEPVAFQVQNDSTFASQLVRERSLRQQRRRKTEHMLLAHVIDETSWRRTNEEDTPPSNETNDIIGEDRVPPAAETMLTNLAIFSAFVPSGPDVAGGLNLSSTLQTPRGPAVACHHP